MRTVECSDGLIVAYCEIEDNYAEAITCCDYVIAKCACFEDASQNMPLKDFSFLNRAIGMKYALKKENDLQNHYGSGVEYIISDNWDVDELFSIAKNYFQKDSRFAFDHFGDTPRKDELLKNYIEYLLYAQTPQTHISYAIKGSRQHKVTLMFKSNECVGFNIWSNNLESRETRIVLSAVHPKIKNSGAAYFLYKRTLAFMYEQGGKYLYEWIASNNIDSLNLHNKLFDGKFKYCGYIDSWMWKK